MKPKDKSQFTKQVEIFDSTQIGKKRRTARFVGLNLSFLVLLILGFLAIYYFTGCWHKAAVASLWALAALALGAIVGLLFGVQRVVQSKPGDAAKNEAGNNKNEINNNLAEVSDWLTKIIVGVGLVELSTLPGRLHKVAQPLANCLAECVGLDCGLAMALAIIVFYSALGFLIGFVDYRTLIALMISDADHDVINNEKLDQVVIDVANNTLNMTQVTTRVDEVVNKVENLEDDKKWFVLVQNKLAAASQANSPETQKSAADQINAVLKQLKQAQASRPTSRALAILIARLHDHMGKTDESVFVLQDALYKRRQFNIAQDADDAALLYNLACYENMIADDAPTDQEREKIKESAWNKLKESCQLDPPNKMEAEVDQDLITLFNGLNRRLDLI